MAKPSAGGALHLTFMAKAALILGLIWLLVFALSKQGGTLAVLTLGVIIFFLVVKVVLPSRRRRNVIDKATAIIERHAEPLAKKRAQLVQRDSYGRILMEKWHNEIDYFVNHHIRPILTSAERRTLAAERAGIESIIAQRIESVTQARPAFAAISNVASPLEFEVFCAEQLRQNGWTAHVTKQSRDQGVDVIAERQGLRVVFQCKLYSNPVGNKAVQEAVAARAHERATHGAVVTNNRYTRAAEQLATTNRVLLLHYSDLPQLHQILIPLTTV